MSTKCSSDKHRDNWAMHLQTSPTQRKWRSAVCLAASTFRSIPLTPVPFMLDQCCENSQASPSSRTQAVPSFATHFTTHWKYHQETSSPRCRIPPGDSLRFSSSPRFQPRPGTTRLDSPWLGSPTSCIECLAFACPIRASFTHKPTTLINQCTFPGQP